MVLMFTDLLNSSGLKMTLGDVAYATKVARPHNQLFRGILGRFPGAKEINYTGDGFLANFGSVSDAVETALLFHHALRTHAWEAVPVQTRIGIHVGEVVLLGGGDPETTFIASHAADMCARLMNLGGGDQTLLTRHAFDDARQYVRAHPAVDGDAPALAWAAHGRYRFKGRDDDPMEVFEVGAVGHAPLVAPGDGEKARRVLDADEAETLGWRPAAESEIPGRPGWFVKEQLGVGGFGEVWLARQAKMGGERVFKFCFDPERLRSLKRELTIFRLIREALGNRDDIARLHDVRLDKPPFYLESEFVPSGNLVQWSARRDGIESVPLAARLQLMAGICEAVAAAHSVGIIHKDLKPSNVLMREGTDGVAQPVLADFGIGIVTDQSQFEKLGVTQTGFTMSMLSAHRSGSSGTRMYAPPESMLGKAATVQSDIFALGVLLYQLAIGDLHRPLATGWERCEERNVAGTVTRQYYHEGEKRIGGVDAGNYFYTRDHLGSLRELIDSSKAVRARYDYDAPGRRLKLMGDLDTDVGFTGHPLHAATGLYLSASRAYDPELNRWLSRDPIGEEGGINLYGYVGNKPISLIDLLGDAPQELPNSCVANATQEAIRRATGKTIPEKTLRNQISPTNNWTTSGVDPALAVPVIQNYTGAKPITPAQIPAALNNGPVMVTINNPGGATTHEVVATSCKSPTEFRIYDPGTGKKSTINASQINSTYSPIAIEKK